MNTIRELKQQEKYNNMLKRKNKEIESLHQEIKELNDSVIWWTNRFNAVERDNRELKTRIDKAIEYINKHTRYEHDGSDYDYMEWVDIDETNQVFIENILDILQGSESNE